MEKLSFKLDSNKIILERDNAGTSWINNNKKLEDYLKVTLETKVAFYDGIAIVEDGKIQGINGFCLTDRQYNITMKKAQKFINELIKENKWNFEKDIR